MPKKVDGVYPHASPRASTMAPTTQPTSPLPRSVWKRLRNSAPRQTNWVEACPPVKPRNASRLYAGGSFPEGLDLKSTWYETTVTEVLPVLVQRNLIALHPSDDNLEVLLFPTAQSPKAKWAPPSSTSTSLTPSLGPASSPYPSLRPNLTRNSTPPSAYSNTPQASPHIPEVVVWAPTIKTLQPFPHTTVLLA